MSGPTRLDGIKACVFDAYGTLLDVHAPMMRRAHALGPEASAISGLWRQKQLEYSWLRSLMGAYADFDVVTADALDFALETHKVTDPKLRDDLLALYRVLDAYPDALPALKVVRGFGMKTAILTNGSRGMIGSAVEHAGLDAHLDDVLTVDVIGVYKPAPEVYALATRCFEVEPDAICFVSSNGWDVAGAAQFGCQVVHLARNGQLPERLPSRPLASIGGLNELAALLE